MNDLPKKISENANCLRCIQNIDEDIFADRNSLGSREKIGKYRILGIMLHFCYLRAVYNKMTSRMLPKNLPNRKL